MIRRFSQCAFLVAASAFSGFAGPKLDDIVLRLSGTAQVELRFAPGEAFPAFFQKTDTSGKTVLLSFLETETALPWGSIALPAGSPVERVELKRLRSPSGRAFLGIEFGLQSLPKGDWEPKPKNSSALVFALGVKSKPGAPKEWSLAKAVVAPAPAVAPSVPQPKASATSAKEIAKPPAEKAAVPITEIRISASGAKEEVVLMVAGKGIPDYKLELSPGGAAAVAVLLRRVSADSVSKKFDLGRQGRIHGLRWKQSDSGLVVVLILDSNRVPKATAEKGKVSLAFPRRPGSPAFSWTSRKPVPAPSLPVETAADLAGEVAEKAGGLSSSKVFTVSGFGKTMVVTKDSTLFLRGPEKNASAGRALLAGEGVRRLGTQGGYTRVLAGGDTGFIRSGALAYADELSAAQIKSIKTKAQARARAVVAAKPSQPTSAAAAKPPEPPAVEPPPSPAAKGPRVKPGKKGEPKLSMPTPGDNPKVSAEALNAERAAMDSEKMDLSPRDERVSYTSFGRRDPFIPVDQGLLDNGIDIDQMKVVGIVWEASEPMAVLEHVKESSLSFTVRQGDPVRNGRVARITREAVTFELTEFGISRSYTLKLVPTQTQERAGK